VVLGSPVDVAKVVCLFSSLREVIIPPPVTVGAGSFSGGSFWNGFLECSSKGKGIEIEFIGGGVVSIYDGRQEAFEFDVGKFSVGFIVIVRKRRWWKLLGAEVQNGFDGVVV